MRYFYLKSFSYSLMQYPNFSYQSFSPCIIHIFPTILLELNFLLKIENFNGLSLRFCLFLSSRFCIGGFQKAVTKAGSAPYLCTRWMRGKMLTPTCCQRKRPATCIKSSVGTWYFTSIQREGYCLYMWGYQGSKISEKYKKRISVCGLFSHISQQQKAK